MLVQDWSPVDLLMDGGSVITFQGTDTETGDYVRFGVDARIANDLVDLADEVEYVSVEGWQILQRTAAEDLVDIATTERI